MKNYDKYLQELSLTPKKQSYFDLQLSEKKIEHFLFYNKNNFNSYLYGLFSIKKYSPSNLKYSRKIELQLNNNEYFFNISDIHIEIDFNLLGVNECNIFQELFAHIKENMLNHKKFIILLCLNFENIKKELLKIFYSFMKESNIKFIFISNQISFLEENILNSITIKRIDNKPNINNINNDTIHSNVLYIDEIVDLIINKNKTFIEIREKIYNLLIKNYNIHDCIYQIFYKLVELEYIDKDNVNTIFKKLVHILRKYNNNYRSIFHLEHLIIFLMNI
jgi:hypothetical protein